MSTSCSPGAWRAMTSGRLATTTPAPAIAAHLCVSRHTVGRHMANIRQKPGGRSQAADVAVIKHSGRLAP